MEARRDDYHTSRKLKYMLYISGFLDLCGVSMVMPLILPHAQDIGASPTMAGILGSVYGGIQLISSPVVGRWSDRIGRQFSLLVCLFISGCGYTILGLSASLAILFMGRFVLGCFKHSQTISKAFLIDIGPEHERSALFGTFNSFSSIGFVVGPIIGGHLAEISFSLAAFAAGTVFIGNAVLVWWVILHEPSVNQQTGTHMELKKDDKLAAAKKFSSDEGGNFSLTELVTLFRDFDWAELWDLFLIKFLAGFSVIIYRANFTLMLKQKYEASSKTIGYMTSYSGAVATISGFLIGKITDRYNSTAQLLLHITLLQVVTLSFLTLSSSVYQIIFFLTPLSIVTSVSRVAGATLTVSRVGNSKTGSVMGLGQSVMSVARMAAPFFAGVAQEFTVDGAGYMSVTAAVFAVIIMLVRPQDPEIRRKQITR